MKENTIKMIDFLKNLIYVICFLIDDKKEIIS